MSAIAGTIEWPVSTRRSSSGNVLGVGHRDDELAVPEFERQRAVTPRDFAGDERGGHAVRWARLEIGERNAEVVGERLRELEARVIAPSSISTSPRRRLVWRWIWSASSSCSVVIRPRPTMMSPILGTGPAARACAASSARGASDSNADSGAPAVRSRSTTSARCAAISEAPRSSCRWVTVLRRSDADCRVRYAQTARRFGRPTATPTYRPRWDRSRGQFARVTTAEPAECRVGRNPYVSVS